MIAGNFDCGLRYVVEMVEAKHLYKVARMIIQRQGNDIERALNGY